MKTNHETKVRSAIVAAATHIRNNPRLWDFYKVEVPACGTPGCALGWIGYFYGLEEEVSIYKVSELLGFRTSMDFYDACENGFTISTPEQIADKLLKFSQEWRPA